MYQDIRSQTTFSRTVANTAKMGAYYTDVDHCIDIGKMLIFPDEEVCCLEPSIGDAKAVMAVTGAKENPKVKIFGVELNGDVAKATKENPYIEECLEADFLEGVKIKNNAFSLCFGNPPYMEDDLADNGTERVERQFLDKVTNYLQKDGLLIWVIPYRSFIDSSSFRFFYNHYDILAVYRFREDEFRKFHQVVVIARKTDTKFALKQDVAAIEAKYSPLDSIPVLPNEPTERFIVKPSEADKITLFCKKEFDYKNAFEMLSLMGTDDRFDALNKFVDKNVSQEKYRVGDLGRPPIPPKKDSLYLMATTGCGQGIAGCEENHDIHLQRGVAEVVEESAVEKDEGSDKAIERVISRTKVTLTIIEQSGKITELG